MVGRVVGHFLSEPGRRIKADCGLHGRKLHLQDHQALQLPGEKIQLRREVRPPFHREAVTGLLDDPAVALRQKMGKGLRGQREVIFLPDHHAAAFISEVTVVVLFPDPYHGRGVQVSLHHADPGKRAEAFREGRRDKFSFDLHCLNS